jgi:type I restriction enzyme S subunit
MSLSHIPDTWTLTQLSAVTEYGRVEKAEPQEIEDSAWVLELEDIEKNTSRLLARLSFAKRQSKSTKNRFEIGDILYGKLRPYLNKVLIADRPGYCTTEIIPLKAGKYLDSRYLFYWLKHPTFLSYVEAESHGLNMPRLGTETGRAAPFVLAPFNEQKRIADKLGAVLARVDACRDRLDRIPIILKRFRQSVLAEATSGKLTEEWRKQNQISFHWPEAKLADVAVARLGKMVDKNKNQGELTPYLRNINVRWFGFDLEDIQEIRISAKEKKDLALLKGDVLICEGGEPGRCAVWRQSSSRYVYQKALHRVRVSDKLLPDYLCYAIKTAADNKSLSELFTGTTIKHLTGVSLSGFSFKLPSVKEQYEIVRRVESLFAYADRLEARYHAARAQVEKLTPALLAKAFRGELVPQDPNDEPASELLARIAAAKSENKPKQRSGRKAKANLAASTE